MNAATAARCDCGFRLDQNARPLIAITEADLTREAATVTKLLGGKTVRVVWRHRPGELGLEFTDGSRIFVNRAEDGLEISIEGD